MLSVGDATARILARARPLDAERVSLDAAPGRVLAAPVIASRSLPPWDNSAMDGLAVRAADTAAAPVELPISGIMAAGGRPDVELPPGTAYRIMTGAPMPRGADAVVPREDIEDQGERARLSRTIRPGEHVRRAGEDVTCGAEVIPVGVHLGAGEIAMLASLGCAEVGVTRRPRVAILSTGDELCALGAQPGPGQIFSSNEHALAAQVGEAGGVVTQTRLVRDDRAEIEAAIVDALSCDVLITSGGVSVGDFDHVRAALVAVGVVIDFWKVAMRPGKPVVFAAAPSGTLCFGLPGNPVSSMVSFELFVRPALRTLVGAHQVARPRCSVELAVPVAKSAGRAHYVRARLERRGDHLVALPHTRQGSGMLSSLVGVDALVELAAELDVPAGTLCPAILLRAV